ncbi:lysozyme [Clostridium acetobutylicum]|uniref:Autolytic lysozyme n=1 Tax=Clostridium acetobutylicum (strain ATCC 824 / DSM 792 / JCM 1419 / IAM 19013 / LMG 5710 / NBRC 13948 / NRRL B-527 / VKM B-1787 / 2291 / W) TaxID=272562 RepID=LYS_CLOAB|nr:MULTISPECIES: GH25 family lysozyme [Clostridium]P34020.1 RecName: Full=Autolytic lysozyme; AltName: Full=1,4-beta-N-acetylmuramidase; AltName: Full=Autolysin [Clostridium acetobutylicum ATCC 824]AAA23250.1 autolytic lysozyme [Clostridium acetobutylicum]AAK78533.1 Autolytic lysozime (1,4-beta-N-acetylmuramidase), family 25 of glycosyl hydrolases; peptodoglycan-binding domain [Clostridium acetobutylicum ATCC 824]ADZ19606.1 Autolytic lysozime (1,4-beta-N-acetylmuramidase), family 25 of glycosyl
MKGIDIYSGQGSVDFNAVKESGVEVVYIKATEGLTYTDSTYKDFYDGAKNAGLKIGFYHYLRANDPTSEAEHFFNTISGLSLDCKCAIDVEVTLGQSIDQISSNVRKFADYLINKGLDVCVYTYTNFYKDNLNSTVKDLPLWIAEYGVSKPNIDASYVGFQYSDSGSVNGISGSADLDEFSEGILVGGTVVIDPGQGGDDNIKAIQQDLNILLKRGLEVDGIEGPETEAAIKDFQSIMGLTVDGIWGTNTSGAAQQIFSRPLDGVAYPHYEYATRYIQYRVGASVDGTFGSGTKAKVAAWQSNQGLMADGVVGSATWSKLLDEN